LVEGCGVVDVLVVGGCSAGCVVAARLSEDPGCQVLLGDAGPDLIGLADLPSDVRDACQPTEAHDWAYVAEPDGRGRRIPLPRARLMGDVRQRTDASPCGARRLTMTAGWSWATRAGASRGYWRSSGALKPMSTSTTSGMAL